MLFSHYRVQSVKITSNCDVTSCIACNVEHVQIPKNILEQNMKCFWRWIWILKHSWDFLWKISFLSQLWNKFHIRRQIIVYQLYILQWFFSFLSLSLSLSLSLKILSGCLFLYFQSTPNYTRRILWYFQTYLWFWALSVWNCLQKHNLCWWKYAVLEVMVSIGYTFTSTTVLCLKYW